MEFDNTLLERKYSFLRLVGSILKVIAWIIMALASLVGLFMANYGILASIGTIVSGILIGIVLLASAESIRVVIDIEENTRFVAKSKSEDNTTELLAKILTVLENMRNQKIDSEI